MKNKVILQIALKNLFYRTKRSIITVAGLSIAVALVIVFVSFGYGLQYLVVNNFSSMEALKTIDVTAEKSEQIKLDNNALEKFRKSEYVKDVYPLVEMGAKMVYDKSETDVAIIGIDENSINLGTTLKVDDPELASRFVNNSVIVSETAADLIGIKKDVKNPSVSLTINTKNYSDSVETVSENFNVIAYETESKSPVVLVPVKYLQDKGVSRYSIVKVVTKDKNDVSTLRLVLEKQGYKTKTSQDTINQVDDIFTIFQIVLAGFGLVAGVIATLGMFNTLTISLLEKTREIGILKALGAQKMLVLKLLVSEALIMSVLGGIVGILLGMLGAEGVQSVLSLVAASKGADMPRIFAFPPVFILSVFLITGVIGVLTGLFPAYKASSINTLDALRYE